MDVPETAGGAAGAAARFGRFYAPVAVGLFGLSFLPMFHDVVTHDDGVTMTTHYGTLWNMAADSAGDPAVFGIMLLLLLVALLVPAALRRQPGRLLTGSIAVVAALVTLMVIARPGTGSPTPSLTPYAAAGLAVVIATVVLAVAHTIVLSVARTGPPPATPQPPTAPQPPAAQPQAGWPATGQADPRQRP